MSHTSRNFVIAYALLVGLPLLGLAGVLRAGRNLTAPISVDGTWELQAETARLGDSPCGREIASLSNSPLVISQSGKSLVLTFNNAAKTGAAGVLEGKDLTAALNLEPASGSGCIATQPVTLVATVDPHTEPRSLHGSLSVNDCLSCAPLAFHATRLPRAKKDGAH